MIDDYPALLFSQSGEGDTYKICDTKTSERQGF
jgi:hypothetical protein